MATATQERAMQIKLNKIRAGAPIRMGQIMIEAGFSPSTARNPKDLTGSIGWEELKNKYLDDEKAVRTLNELMDSSNEDKDNRLKASIETLKLKDRYPQKNTVAVGLFQTLDNLED